MAPLAGSSFSIDTWKNDPPDVELKCFLPNGIFLTLYVPATATIREIKSVSSDNTQTCINVQPISTQNHQKYIFFLI